MKTLAERTHEALNEGFTVGQLASAAGKSSAAVSQWLSGQTRSLKADSAVGLEVLTGWHASWWATGKGDRGDTRKSRTGLGMSMHTLLSAGKPLSVVEGLRGYLKEHNATRRRLIGGLLAQLAEDPANEELADELATQLEAPEQQVRFGNS